MDEYLLHFIWGNRYYNCQNLKTVDGQILEIVHQGTHNFNQGPDFLHGRIKIDNTLMVGHIELHVQSSDWLLHGHQTDPHYKNIILHVVWNHNKEINLPFPTVELKNCVAKLSLSQYKHLRSISQFIPCEKLIQTDRFKLWQEFYNDLVNQRLHQRAEHILSGLLFKKGNWEQQAWLHIATFLGGKQNGEAMEMLFSSIPFETLKRLRGNLFHLEAVFFGQSGLLHPDLHEEYPTELLKTYIFLKHKFKLVQPHLQWMFFRMRPVNFPTLRIAQLAALFAKIPNVMSAFLTDSSQDTIETMLHVDLNSYWKNHYRFGKQTSFQIKHSRKFATDYLIINALVPLLYAYGTYHQIDDFKNKAISLLKEIKPENNLITKGFHSLNFLHSNSMDSQALLQLYAAYCKPKKCLMCALGKQIITSEINMATPNCS
jgi:hypothetical protein